MDPDKTSDPWVFFESWLADAEQSGLPVANAMTLATTGEDGGPSARVVLYKGRLEGGLSFFTNYESRKGRELARAPQACLVFHWAALERQVRVEGEVFRLSPECSDEYFATRPRGSQLGAWASPQSEPLESRAQLDRRLADTEQRFAGQPVPRPPHWGGYRVVPRSFEFWMADGHRLNRRWLFLASQAGWRRQLLAP